MQKEKSILKKHYEAPDNADILLLYNNASPLWLKKSIALAAFCGMRRGEIAALKYKDILREQNKIFVHSSLVKGFNAEWVTNTPMCNYVVSANPDIIKLLGEGAPDDYVIGYTPNIISYNLKKLRSQHNLTIGFKELRYYFHSKFKNNKTYEPFLIAKINGDFIVG